MNLTSATILTELLDRASTEPFGLAITTNNAKALQVNLCNAQRSNGRRDLIISLPAEPDTVFIVKRSVELG